MILLDVPASLGFHPGKGTKVSPRSRVPPPGRAVRTGRRLGGGQREKDRLLVSSLFQRKIVFGGEASVIHLVVLGASSRHPGVPVPSRSSRTDKKPNYHEIQPGVSLRLLPAAKFTEPLNALSWELPAALAQADLIHIHQAAMRASESGPVDLPSCTASPSA